MNVFDAITLQAFSLARLRLNGDLPDSLQQMIYNVGQAVVNHQPGVAEEVRDLVQQYGCLQEPYERAYSTLQKHYQIPDAMGTLTADGMGVQRPTWERIVAFILTAEDPKVAVEQVVKQERSHQSSPARVPQPFLVSLQRELAVLNQQAIAILKTLERQLLSIDDLAYHLNLPTDQTRRVVQMLWNEGYITPTKSGLLSQVSIFKTSSHRHQVTDLSMRFVLTLKGHFYLHPFVTTRRSGGITR